MLKWLLFYCCPLNFDTVNGFHISLISKDFYHKNVFCLENTDTYGGWSWQGNVEWVCFIVPHCSSHFFSQFLSKMLSSQVEVISIYAMLSSFSKTKTSRILWFQITTHMTISSHDQYFSSHHFQIPVKKWHLSHYPF